MSKTHRRLFVALAACLALIAAPSAAAAPTAVDFGVTPAQPQSGVAATLTGSATPALLSEITAWEWDLDGNIATIERTGQTVNYPFPTAGTYQVTLRVTSNEVLDNQASATKAVTVRTRPPTASFDFNPISPRPGDEILFVSTSSDPDPGETGSLAHSWDFGDGAFESGTTTPRHSYQSPGTKTVRLEVSDGKGGSGEATRNVTVRDPSAPNASFTVSPQSPVENQAVTLTSTSTPSAGQTITALDWDLDADGQYDDAEGAVAARSFDSRGVYGIALRVRQSNGEIAIAEGSVRVGALPVLLPPPNTPPPPPTVKSRPSLLSPFPVVRLRGQAYLGRTVVTLLSVRAPRGSLARVRCKGERCPKAVRRKRSKGKLLRFKTFERSLPAGARLQIVVVHPKRIGKYTSFKLRSGKFPARKDLCVAPGKRKPRACARLLRR